MKNYFVVSFAIAFFLSFAFLRTTTVEAGQKPLVVVIAAQSDQKAFEKISVSMVAQFADLDVKVSTLWLDSIPPLMPAREQLAAKIMKQNGAIVVMWLDLEAPKMAYFYLTVANDRKVLVRRIDNTGESGLADAVAIIARSAVEAVMDGGKIVLGSEDRGNSSTKVEQPMLTASNQTSSQKTTQESDNTAQWYLNAGYTNTLFNDKFESLHGARVSLSFLASRRSFIFAGYTFHQVIEDQNEWVRFELHRRPVHIGAALFRSFERWSFSGSLSLVIDYMRRETVAVADGVTAKKPYSRFGFSLEPMFRTELHVRGSLSIFVTTGLEMLLIKKKWTIDGGSSLADMWRFQPRLFVGAQIELF